MGKNNFYDDEQIFNEYLNYRKDKDSPHSLNVKPAINELVGNVKGKKAFLFFLKFILSLPLQ